MTRISKKIITLFAGTILLATTPLSASEAVTVDNFVRAETDMTLKRYFDQGGFGKFFHVRKPTPIDQQDVIRMNRDTLYSGVVFDLTEPVTLIKPESKDRFQSMQIINQDHSMQPVEEGSGTFTLTQDKIGTRYVFVIIRTFMDANDPEDVKKANALQDKVEIKQSKVGTFTIPDWDQTSLKTVREAINVLASTKTSSKGMFGDKAKLNPINHLLGTAFGWGGSPMEAAMYINGAPAKNDGKTPYTLTAKDVPVDGFWSITIYNKKGFMQENDLGVDSFNIVTAKPNEDGSITIHLGGDASQVNYLPITEGWNYIIRLYQPRKEAIDGSWTFPEPKPVK